MAQFKRLIIQLLVLVSVVAITSVSLAKAPPEAKEHLDAGLAYFDDPAGPRYEDAYREFHAAYDIYPSYQLLANIGTCALYLERDAEAIEAYERYLKEAAGKDIPQNKRTLMEKDIKTLKASLVRLNITVTPATVTLIDERFTSKGESIVNRYEVKNGTLTLGIHPGNHRITAHLEGFEDQHWEVDAKPASNHSHAYRLVEAKADAPTPALSEKQPAPTATESDLASKKSEAPKSRPTPTSVYVGLAVTGVFAVGTAVGGVLSVSKRSDYVDANDGKHVDQADSLRTDLNRYLLVTGIAGGATLVAAGVTTYLYLARPEKTDTSQDKQANWYVVPVIATERAGVSLGGRF